MTGASLQTSADLYTDACTDNEYWPRMRQRIRFPNASVQCHRFTFNTSRVANKLPPGIVIGSLLPLNIFEAAEYACKSANNINRMRLSIQLTEAFLLAVQLALDRLSVSNIWLKDIVTGVEIRDSCLESQFTVSHVLEMAKSSPKVERLCSASQEGNFVNVYRESIVVGGKHLDSGGECADTQSNIGSGFSRRVPIVIGPGISGNVEVSAPTLSVFKLPHITYWGTSALFEDKQQYPHLFRTVPSDRYQAQAMASVMKAYNWRYVYALASNDQITGSQGLRFFREAVSSLGDGYCIAYEAQFHKDDAQRLREIVKRVIMGRPSASFSASGEKVYSDPSVIMLFAGFQFAGKIFDTIAEMRKEGDAAFNKAFASTSFVWLASDGWISRAESFLVKHQLTNHSVIGFTFNVPSKFGIQQREFASNFSHHLEHLKLNKETVLRNSWLGVLWQIHRNCSAKFIDPNCANNPNVDGCCDENETASSVFGITTDNLSPPLASGALWLAVEGAVKTLSTAVRDWPQCQGGVSGDTLRGILEGTEVECGNSSRLCRIFTKSQDVEPEFTVKAVLFNGSNFRSTEIGSWSEEREIDFICPNGDTGENCRMSIFPSGVPESICSSQCKPGYKHQEAKDLIRSSSGSCCWQCSKCPHNQYTYNGTSSECLSCSNTSKPNEDQSGCVPKEIIHYGFSNPLGIVIVVLSTVGTLSVLFTFWAFHRLSKHEVPRESGGKQNYAMFIALIAAYLNAMFLLQQPSCFFCFSSSITTATIITLIMSLLMSRCFRLLWLGRNHHPISKLNLIVATKCGKTLHRQLAFVATVQVLMGAGIHTIMQIIKPHCEDEDKDSLDTEIHLVCVETGYFKFVSLGLIVTLMLLMTFYVVITRGIINLPNLQVHTSQSSASFDESSTVDKKVAVQEAKLLLFAGLAICVLIISLTPTFQVTSRILWPLTIGLSLICESVAVWCCLYVPRLYVMRMAIKDELRSLCTGTPTKPRWSTASSMDSSTQQYIGKIRDSDASTTQLGGARSWAKHQGTFHQTVDDDSPPMILPTEFKPARRAKSDIIIMETST